MKSELRYSLHFASLIICIKTRIIMYKKKIKAQNKKLQKTIATES